MDRLKNKITAIIAPVLMLGFAFLILSDYGQNEEIAEPQTENTVVAKTNPADRIDLTEIDNEPLMPYQFEPLGNWRDPFAAPRQTLIVKEEPAKNLTINDKLIPSDAGTDIPSLTGIISSAERKLAIIQHGGKSRPYKEGDSAGEYKVLKIEEKTVVLETGAKMLTIRVPGI